MAKYSMSMPQEMMTAAEIILKGDDQDAHSLGVSEIVQAVFADFLLRHGADENPHVIDYLRTGVSDRFKATLLEKVEP